MYAVLGRAEPALHHGRRALEVAESHDLSPFDVGCGHEALARAYRVAGDLDAVADHVAAATALAEKVSDAEDRDILLGDLAQLQPPHLDASDLTGRLRAGTCVRYVSLRNDGAVLTKRPA